MSMLKKLEARKRTAIKSIEEKIEKQKDLGEQRKKCVEDIKNLKEKIKQIEQDINAFKVNEIARLLRKKGAIDVVYDELKSKDNVLKKNEEGTTNVQESENL